VDRDPVTDRKQPDRHYRGPQVPVGVRLDKDDYDALETRRKTLSLNRRQAIIAAIREWAGVGKHAPEATGEQK
jgi:hypothetical protein